MVRVATAPIPLSTGQTIPIGTRFGFSAWAIHNSPNNPIFLPNTSHIPSPPEVFDGFRFEKLRKIPGNENKYSYVTTSPDSLNFGHGVHACPGRFFASNEIKIVLIDLLWEWDFRFLGGGSKRPENTWGDMNCYPDTRALMEFRKRKSGTA
jgi:cytochrome P450